MWAALDELEEDQLIEDIVEGLMNDVDAANQEGEECDHGSAYSDSNSEAGDSGDDEDKLYFPPLPTRNLWRDTLYGHAHLVDDAMSDDEIMEPRMEGQGLQREVVEAAGAAVVLTTSMSTTAAVAVAAATTVVVEAAAERVATTTDMEVEELIVEAGARRGALTPVMEMMEQIRVREEPKKPDRKSYMMCGKDPGHTTEERMKVRKFVANLQVTNGNGPKTP
eukprot:jgi/Tetstr1/453754/TSEL_040706.t1